MSLPFLLWLTVVALGWFGHAPPELLLDLELHHGGHGLAPVPQGLDHDGQPQLVWTTPGGHSLFHVLCNHPTACRHNPHVLVAEALLAVPDHDAGEPQLVPLLCRVPLVAGSGC